MSTAIQLTNGSILLRPSQMSDIGPMYEAVRESITEVSRWLAWCCPDYSVEDSRTWIESRPAAWEHGSEYSFAITDREDGTFLGTCGLNRLDPIHRWANLGYWVRSSRARKGVATAATLLVARFAFQELKLNRVEIVIAAGNHASLRVADKVVATRVGLLRSKIASFAAFHPWLRVAGPAPSLGPLPGLISPLCLVCIAGQVQNRLGPALARSQEKAMVGTRVELVSLPHERCVLPRQHKILDYLKS